MFPCRGLTSILYILIVAVLIWSSWYIISHEQEFSQKNDDDIEKYLKVPLSDGRIMNHMFNLMSEIFLAKKLSKSFYINIEDFSDSKEVSYNLNRLYFMFPHLRETYLIKNTENNNVSRSNSGDSLHLSKIKKDERSYLCAQIHVSDPAAVVSIISEAAKAQKLSLILLLGRNTKFLKKIVDDLQNVYHLPKESVFLGSGSDSVDLYLAQRLCHSFIITAPLTTFGFWLGFSIENENNVFLQKEPHSLRIERVGNNIFA